MKIQIALCFEEGDVRDHEYTLQFADGSSVNLSHAVSSALVSLSAFTAAPAKPVESAAAPAPAEVEAEHPTGLLG